jgi:hypothetical protein
VYSFADRVVQDLRKTHKLSQKVSDGKRPQSIIYVHCRLCIQLVKGYNYCIVPYLCSKQMAVLTILRTAKKLGLLYLFFLHALEVSIFVFPNILSEKIQSDREKWSFFCRGCEFTTPGGGLDGRKGKWLLIYNLSWKIGGWGGRKG